MTGRLFFLLDFGDGEAIEQLTWGQTLPKYFVDNLRELTSTRRSSKIKMGKPPDEDAD